MGEDRHLRVAGEEHPLVVKLRRRRVTFDDIGAHLGITPAEAHDIYQQALGALPDQDRGEHKAEEIMLADDAIRDLLPIARQHDKSARTSVEAWNSIRGWAEHKARLTGPNSPQAEPVPEGRLRALRAARPA